MERDDHFAASASAEALFVEGLELLRRCAAILRSPSIDPSPAAMRTEMALTRAIEALSSTGFCAPKR
jgi:hypothetical protein